MEFAFTDHLVALATAKAIGMILFPIVGGNFASIDRLRTGGALRCEVAVIAIGATGFAVAYMQTIVFRDQSIASTTSKTSGMVRFFVKGDRFFA